MKTKFTLLACLLIFSLLSCEKEEDNPIEPPVGGFTFTTDSLDVTCTSTSTGEIITLTWEFGDTGFNTDENNQVVTHSYDSAGTYSITLTAANGSGHGIDIQDVTVQ
ncbi:MAG: PKD domain-containing protein [Flavobacteriales bacterium]|nr:PKD domain-containing protein [Flavobacteriales bacterium]